MFIYVNWLSAHKSKFALCFHAKNTLLKPKQQSVCIFRILNRFKILFKKKVWKRLIIFFFSDIWMISIFYRLHVWKCMIDFFLGWTSPGYTLRAIFLAISLNFHNWSLSSIKTNSLFLCCFSAWVLTSGDKKSRLLFRFLGITENAKSQTFNITFLLKPLLLFQIFLKIYCCSLPAFFCSVYSLNLRQHAR